MRARNFCWTLNNPTEEDVSRTEENLRREVLSGLVKYSIHQPERGESGTLHLQGYTELGKALRGGGFKDLLGTPRVHIETRKGSREQARDYCRKSESSVGDVVELGQFGQERGKRKDIESFRDRVIDGASDRELFIEHPRAFLAYNGALERARLSCGQKEIRDVTVIVLSGVTGAGKSHFAWTFRGLGETYKLASKKPLWFDGYSGERTLFIDEYVMDPPKELMLEICDKWPYMCPIKGGFKYAQWDTVIISTNCDKWGLQQLWGEEMERRITEWKIFKKRYREEVVQVAGTEVV